eukprot:153911-Karenia_brevis.AAC.1
MYHDSILWALLKRDLKVEKALAIARELMHLKARVHLPGAPISEPFDYLRGGVQGGVLTPEEWNLLLEAILEP